MLFGDMSSNEWIALAGIVAGVAIPSTLGWVAVFVQLVLFRSEMKALSKTLGRVEADLVRNWDHISKHEGRIDELDRVSDRLLDAFGMERPKRA